MKTNFIILITNIFVVLTLVSPMIVAAQGIKNQGAKIVVGSGAFFNITGIGGHLLNQTNVTKVMEYRRICTCGPDFLTA